MREETLFCTLTTSLTPSPIAIEDTLEGLIKTPRHSTNHTLEESSQPLRHLNHGINIRFPRITLAIEESIVWDGVYFV
ncbi:hypothetical protein LguiA_007631 [Lonicera macranthoides]